MAVSAGPLRMSAGETLLRSYFADAFRQVTRRGEPPEIQVTFFPFAGLNHTIRIRRQRIYVRVSDLLREAPPQVHQALAHILISKLFRKRVSPEHQDLYRQFAFQPHMLRASELARRERGRTRIRGVSIRGGLRQTPESSRASRRGSSCGPGNLAGGSEAAAARDVHGR